MTRIPDNTNQPVGGQGGGEFQPTHLYLPKVSENFGGVLFGAEVAKAGDDLAKVAAQGLKYERQNQLASLAAKSSIEMFNYVKALENDSRPPDQILQAIPNGIAEIKARMSEGLDDNIKGAFNGVFDRAAVKYYQHAANHAQGRANQQLLAGDENQIRENINTINQMSDPSMAPMKADLIGQTRMMLNEYAQRPYWNPTALQPYHRHLDGVERDAGLYGGAADVREWERRRDMVINRTDGANIPDAERSRVVEQFNHMITLQDKQTTDMFTKFYPNQPVPPHAVELAVKTGKLSQAGALKINNESEFLNYTQNFSVPGGGGAWLESMAQGGQAGLLEKNPKMFHQVKALALESQHKDWEQTSKAITWKMANNDYPAVQEALDQAKLPQYRHLYNPSFIVQMERAVNKDNKDPDPQTYVSCKNLLAGPAFTDDGKPTLTSEKLGELYLEGKLGNKYGELWGRWYDKYGRYEQGQHTQLMAASKEIRNAYKGLMPEEMFNPDTDTGARTDVTDPNYKRATAISQHMNATLSECANAYNQFVKEKPGASPNELLQVLSVYTSKAQAYKKTYLLEMMKESEKQNMGFTERAWNYLTSKKTTTTNYTNPPPIPVRRTRGGAGYTAPPRAE